MSKPRLFYWEEGIGAWCPVPEHTDHLLDVDDLCEREVREIKFKRMDMTDEEFENIQEM